MKTRIGFAVLFAGTLALSGAAFTFAGQSGAGSNGASSRPQGPCDIYAAAGDPCVAAHSTTRALYAGYDGPLYQVLRQTDGTKMDIGVVHASASDAGGYADAAAQDKFCANTVCWITTVYDQSGHHNDLTQAPRGGFSGPAMGGFNNVPIADMAPVTVMGHKVYGVFIEPGMGIRNDDPKGTAVDDQAEGQYWVINGRHYNSGCCFDYGNAETDSRDDDNGTMETAYYGNAAAWYHGQPPGPWVMTDQENNLVGCVVPDGSKFCADVPSIDWRFVTAIAKGEPHHWTSMGGNSQSGELSVMFSGQRVNGTYDPMRKQGAILLGNGGDNSNGSQGTFYEGALTAANTFPSDATDQKVQANVVAARYAELPVSIAPASATQNAPGLQIFTPGSSQETTVTFKNTTGAPAAGVTLSISAPSQWTAAVSGGADSSKSFTDAVAPGASVSATFKVTSGQEPFNGNLVAEASWTDRASGAKESETAAEKVRSDSPVRINEFRISSGPPSNATDSFIELYNAGQSAVNLSNWSLTEHPTQQAIFSIIRIPSGTNLAPHGFYLLGLSDSGLTVPAKAGDSTLLVRSTTGMSAGDTVTIGAGSGAETRKIANVGTAASTHTTLWQPLPEGPIITIPAGSTNVPVTNASGFKVGEKIALGYGATYPSVARGTEKYEVATVTVVGKPGTQAYLGADAHAGATNIQVTSVADISVGDKITLDIDSVGHGIETVTVAHVGTQATRSNLTAATEAGATTIRVRSDRGFEAGGKIDVGTPANRETVTVKSVSSAGAGAGRFRGATLEISPALAKPHISDETVMALGTGLDLAAPLKFDHSSNLPFSDRGTGITFEPATAFEHSSNEPVQALGTGITLDQPLSNEHAINDVVRDASVKTAGYQGSPEPNQWFGGPELSTSAQGFGTAWLSLKAGSMVLRDANDQVVDSLNYGGLVDPWAAEGYQGVSGAGKTGCYVAAPGETGGYGPIAPPNAADTSAGRFPDGADTGSNCTDFMTSPATSLSIAAAAGANNIKVASVEGFHAGQTIRIDSGANLESAQIATVGTAGATTASAEVAAGATEIPVANGRGFSEGETVQIGSGADAENAVVVRMTRFPVAGIVVSSPLTKAHAAGSEIAGSGITLRGSLAHEHASEAPVTGSIATPGAPNEYEKAAQ